MTDQLNAIRERLERAKLYSVNIDTVVYEFDNECVMLSDWIKSQHADLSKLLRAVEVLNAALKNLEVAVNDKVSDPGATAFIKRARAQAEEILNE